jgi:hypothetical protein
MCDYLAKIGTGSGCDNLVICLYPPLLQLSCEKLRKIKKKKFRQPQVISQSPTERTLSYRPCFFITLEDALVPYLILRAEQRLFYVLQ